MNYLSAANYSQHIPSLLTKVTADNGMCKLRNTTPSATTRTSH